MTIPDACSDYDVTRAQAAVLVCLSQAAGRVVGKQTLRDAIESVTGKRCSEMAMQTAMKHLRRKLRESLGFEPFKTEYGIGYSMVIKND